MGLSQITDRWHFLSEHAGIISLDPVEPRQLKRFPVFAGLEFETLDRIAPDITLARWHDGAFLFEEGAYIDLAFIIVNGRVRLLSSLHRQPVAGRSLSFLAMLGMEEAAGITRLTLEKNRAGRRRNRIAANTSARPPPATPQGRRIPSQA